MNNKTIRPFFIILIAFVILLDITLIVFKDNKENKNIEKENSVQENISITSEDNTFKLDKVIIKEENNEKYLIFDIVKLDNNVENIEFILQLLYDGNPVFEENINIEEFNKKSINKKIKLNNFKYKLNELSVNLKSEENETSINDEQEVYVEKTETSSDNNVLAG